MEGILNALVLFANFVLIPSLAYGSQLALGALGVTLVFHPLEGINPIEIDEEVDWPSWPVDIDDDLTRNAEDPMNRQFDQIARQLKGLSTEKLLEYLALAREEAGGEG